MKILIEIQGSLITIFFLDFKLLKLYLFYSNTKYNFYDRFAAISYRWGPWVLRWWELADNYHKWRVYRVHSFWFLWHRRGKIEYKHHQPRRRLTLLANKTFKIDNRSKGKVVVRIHHSPGLPRRWEKNNKNLKDLKWIRSGRIPDLRPLEGSSTTNPPQ